MANNLNIDLTGKVVIFRQECLTVPQLEHPFRVDGGFGASPSTIGRALIGEFLSDGERARMEGYMVERLATEEEIAAVHNSHGHDWESCQECVDQAVRDGVISPDSKPLRSGRPE